MLRIPHLIDQIENIEGWFTPGEAEALAAAGLLALASSRGAWVEVGSWKGRTTVLLATLLRELRPEQILWAIDPHEGVLPTPGTDGQWQGPTSWPVYLANLQRHGVAGNVATIRKAAEAVNWTEPIALLFIDSLHDYTNTSAHFGVFAPSLEPGAIVAFHDCNPTDWPGVVRVVAELESAGYERLWMVDTLAVLRKL